MTAASRTRAGRTGRRLSGGLPHALLCALLVSGCGASAARVDGATDAGRRFAAALAAGDHRAACALLAPATREEIEDDGRIPCRTALREAGPPVAGQPRGTDVYGNEALVRMTGDTLFLSRFDEGWRVTAAGCEPQGGDEPYRCSVKGG
ncbi:hypothetical protein [Streptomyces omiyaensis]|uniref:Lipoprotein n=1 Tax=Streptomyces omiyaensis TaxID=68247 RepID=A0ABW7C390_9ACTN